MANLKQTDWKNQLSNDANAIILDVRTSDEFDEGHIQEALHIDFREPQEFLNKVASLDKNKNFYVYCQSGNRGSQACAVLNQMCSIQHTFNLEEGFAAW